MGTFNKEIPPELKCNCKFFFSFCKKRHLLQIHLLRELKHKTQTFLQRAMGQAISRCLGRRGRTADSTEGEGRSPEGVPTGMMSLTSSIYRYDVTDKQYLQV